MGKSVMKGKNPNRQQVVQKIIVIRSHAISVNKICENTFAKINETSLSYADMMGVCACMEVIKLPNISST